VQRLGTKKEKKNKNKNNKQQRKRPISKVQEAFESDVFVPPDSRAGSDFHVPNKDFLKNF